MKFFNKNRFPGMIIDGHKTSVLKISEDFEYELNGDELILKSPVRIPWHHEQSPYRYVVTIHSDFDDVDGFQVNLSELYKNSDLNTRDDIFVYDKEGNLINHWLKPGDGEFWIKLPLQAGDINTICVYFGSGISNLGNGDDVFEFFDDFDGNDLDTDKWTFVNDMNGTYEVSDSVLILYGSSNGSCNLVSNPSFDANIILETRQKIPIDPEGDGSWRGRQGFNAMNNPTYNSDTYNQTEFYVGDSGQTVYVHDGSSADSISITLDSIDSYHKYSLVWLEDGAKLYQNDVLKGEVQSNKNSTGPCRIENRIWFGGKRIIDWIRIRKYIDKEPYIISYKKQSKD